MGTTASLGAPADIIDGAVVAIDRPAAFADSEPTAAAPEAAAPGAVALEGAEPVLAAPTRLDGVCRPVPAAARSTTTPGAHELEPDRGPARLRRTVRGMGRALTTRASWLGAELRRALAGITPEPDVEPRGVAAAVPTVAPVDVWAAALLAAGGCATAAVAWEGR